MKLPTKPALSASALLASTAAIIGFQFPASAATIAGSDFSDAAVFGGSGGAYDIVNTDDLDPDDGITVNPWTFANLQSPPETNFTNFDGNSLPGMASDQVTKINGISGAPLPMIGDDPSSFATVSFSIVFSDDIQNFSGWYIDDVELSTPAP